MELQIVSGQLGLCYIEKHCLKEQKQTKKLRIVKWGASRRGWGGETNQNALSEKKSIFNTNKKPKNVTPMDPFGAAHIYTLYGYVHQLEHS